MVERVGGVLRKMALVLMFAYSAPMVADEAAWAGGGSDSCREGYDHLLESGDLSRPSRVLLVPLLRADPGTDENENWPELPAASLTRFYQQRFQADVVWMREVRIWSDYYEEIDRLTQEASMFDRVIFIGHGGFDGPILNGDVLQQKLRIERSENTMSRSAEMQPGLRQTLTITYDNQRNPAFGDYVTSHWQELMQMSNWDAVQQLHEQERQLQPLDQACFARNCPAEHLDAAGDAQNRQIRINACNVTCREPLFVWQPESRVDAGLFERFAKSLAAVVRTDGLIFFGSCNPGTVVSNTPDPWHKEGSLSHSTLAGGPHQSYVHLAAAATDRNVAGPIGKSSARDIVDKVRLLESRAPQRSLCAAGKPLIAQ
jgi:hypothetical protein